MNLAQQLTTDMESALKAGETERLGTLRLLRSSVANEKIKLGHEPSDDEVLKVLQREAKQRRDSIEQYQAAGREDLATKEEHELSLVQTYLPKALSESELTKIVDTAVTAAGPNPQMGVVIGAVMSQVGAQADGGTVSKLVRERLGQ